MGWRNVVITKHSKLSYSSRMLIVQTIDGINQIPIDDINSLLIDTTQAVITSALISQLSQKQVKVIFTDERKEPVCETISKFPNNRTIKLLDDQFKWPESRKEILWTKIVTKKIVGQINVIRWMGGNAALLEHELNEIEVNDVTNREAVVARKYFPMLFDDLSFRRHDNDQVINAALNYGYSILLSTINKEITREGYLTYLGIHHHSDNNSFNLGSDLMEPFRPIVDLWIANKDFKTLTPEIKYGLVSLLNLEIEYDGKKMLLNNALNSHVRRCLTYLTNGKEGLEVEMEFENEVSDYALNGNV